MTCISPWNSRSTTQRAGTAVTKRHMVLAQHFSLEVGDTVRFVTADNVVVTRTIVSIANVPWPEGTINSPEVSYSDVQVVQLDSDLPETITPCQLFEPDYTGGTELLPTLSTTYFDGVNVPCLSLDQEEKALVYNVVHIGASAALLGATSGIRASYSEEIIGGDSGNPSFLIHPDALILITTWTTGGTGGTGPSYTYLLNELQGCINSLCTAASINSSLYQIQKFTVS